SSPGHLQARSPSAARTRKSDTNTRGRAFPGPLAPERHQPAPPPAPRSNAWSQKPWAWLLLVLGPVQARQMLVENHSASQPDRPLPLHNKNNLRVVTAHVHMHKAGLKGYGKICPLSSLCHPRQTLAARLGNGNNL